MKRRSSIVTILLTSLLATTVAGQTLTVGSASVQCGKSVSVPVTISDTSGLLAVQFDVGHDSSKLTPTKVVAGSLTSGFSLLSNITSSPVKIAMASGSPVSGSGTVATISYSAGASASGTATLSVSAILINDVEKNGNNGTVTITCQQEPLAPTLVSPADGANDVAAPVKLRWEASAGADEYRVYFGTGTPKLIKTTPATSFNVETAPGTTYSWNVRAVNGAGASSSSATRSFKTAGTFCDTPAAPTLTAPATVQSVQSGTTYDVSWTPVANTSDYVIEEAQNASFTGSASTTTTATTVALSKSVAANTTFFYRVRARNTSHNCNVDGPFSSSAAVTVTPKPLIPPGSAVLAAVGSSPGASGSMFRTSIQLYNHTDDRLRGRIVYHPAGITGSDNDPALPYDLAPGVTLSLLDLLPAMGITSGLGSADLVPDPLGSALPLFVTRIYSDGGAKGTAGMTLDPSRLDDALFAGQTGAIITAMNPAGARMSIGIRTLGHGAVFTVTMRDKAGQVVTSRQHTFGPTFFVQSTAEQLIGVPLTPDASLTFRMEFGSAIIYGSTTDNLTQDTSIQIARPLH